MERSWPRPSWSLVVVIAIAAGPGVIAGSAAQQPGPAPAPATPTAPDRLAGEEQAATTDAVPMAAPPHEDVPSAAPPPPPSIALGRHTITFGLDFTFAGIHDAAQTGSMGRERQLKPGYVILSLAGDVTPRLSYRLEINPVDDSIVPRPYTPGENDRRTYFFPNRVDQEGGRGVSSDPAGLYMVDTYKHPGFDPYLHAGLLRTAQVDIHTPSRRVGLVVGRLYVPQGLPVSMTTWFSAKDLNKIQLVNAQIDNGVLLYLDRPRVRVEVGVISGNGSPYHDYGYFDHTVPHEDKNSAFGTLARVSVRPLEGLFAGVSAKHNYLNSRIEDSVTLQLSKKHDDAFIGFFHYRPARFLTVYGEVARYKWGMRGSSADLIAGPRPSTPIWKDGYYVGAEATAPRTRAGQFGITVTRGEISRDDSLVSWAAANDMLGVRLGKKERSTVIKLTSAFGDHLQVYGFYHALSNPFPELSAIVPIAGAGAGSAVSSDKHGCGLRVRF